MKVLASVIGAIFALCGSTASAALVTVDFTGTIASVDPGLGGAVVDGETISGSFTYNSATSYRVGDKIKVRIELRVDREMEYVHMKDMRASCLEPVNVLSGYKWQGGLGYYETTKDASANFFFDNLRKGTYVFEYALFVTHTGNFSNGITSIQCMYTPEFASHSEGIRINVE